MVDPITLTGLALAGGAGFLGSQALSSSAPGTSPAPTPAPPPAAPAQQPGAKAAPRGQQPTFLGAAAVPEQSGTKTLLGQ